MHPLAATKSVLYIRPGPGPVKRTHEDMRNHLIIPVLISIVLLTGCRMELPEQGSEAERLYAAKCALCHPAFHPKTLSAKAWETIVKRMEKKVAAMEVREPLNEAERALILGYLKKHSRERMM